MAEETKNASSSAPKGIVLTTIATAITGLIYLVGLLYACNNKIGEYFEGETQYPVINLYIAAFTDKNMSFRAYCFSSRSESL